jgi:NAD(P)-dependent dehydrogenase (short-subunit alcohol dehydrogenase family)
MDLHLDGKIAVVTGASKGIGLAISSALIDAGAHVVAGSRSYGPGLAKLAETGRLTHLAVDLALPDGATSLAAAAAERGGIDILVNNAGAVTPRTGGFAEISDEEWLATWTLGLMSTVRTTRAALPHLIRSASGSIVIIGSVNAYLPDPVVLDYSATKAALTNLAKGLSKELGQHNIRVNTISPGPVATDLWLGAGGVAATVSGVTGMSPTDIADSAVAGTVTQRFTTPSEVADLAVFLASDRAANITGTDVTIDGGMITTI